MKTNAQLVVALCALCFGIGTASAEVFVGAGINNNSYDYDDLDTSTGSKLYVGYYAENGLFGEVAAIDLGDTQSNLAPLGLSISGLAGYIGYRSQTAVTGLGGFGKVGAYSFDSDLTAFGSTVATRSSSGLAWSLGLLYAFNKNFALRAEVEQFVSVEDFANNESVSGFSASLEVRF